VVFGGRRMSIGAPGDAIALGRWNCASATVAVLRPATGEVFRFEGWASAGRPVDALPVGAVEGAVGVHAVAGARPGCDDIAVARATGPPVVVWRAP
jgi:predicted nucleotidyltransferase